MSEIANWPQATTVIGTVFAIALVLIVLIIKKS